MKVTIILSLLGFALCAPSDFRLSSLIDDFNGLLKLIPFDKVEAILDDHLEHDAEFGEVIRYLQGDEWAKLVLEVHNQPEWQDFVKYLDNAGFNIEEFVQLVHEIIKGLKPGTDGNGKENIRSFLDEAESVLPLEQMFYYLNDRMENSEDFKAFYARISSPKSKDLVEQVRALPEVQRVGKRLIDMGVRVPELLDIIYDFLGWN